MSSPSGAAGLLAGTKFSLGCEAGSEADGRGRRQRRAIPQQACKPPKSGESHCMGLGKSEESSPATSTTSLEKLGETEAQDRRGSWRAYTRPHPGLWFLRDVPALLSVMLSFWPLVIVVIANGAKAMRGRKISPAVYQHLMAMLPVAEAQLLFALQRQACRGFGWNVRAIRATRSPPCRTGTTSSRASRLTALPSWTSTQPRAPSPSPSATPTASAPASMRPPRTRPMVRRARAAQRPTRRQAFRQPRLARLSEPSS